MFFPPPSLLFHHSKKHGLSTMNPFIGLWQGIVPFLEMDGQTLPIRLVIEYRFDVSNFIWSKPCFASTNSYNILKKERNTNEGHKIPVISPISIYKGNTVAYGDCYLAIHQ